MKSGWIAESIDSGVNLGAQPVLAASDGLIRALFQRPGPPRRMLMGTHNGRVNHRVFVVCIPGQMLEYPLPHTALGPTAEACMRQAEIAEPFR